MYFQYLRYIYIIHIIYVLNIPICSILSCILYVHVQCECLQFHSGPENLKKYMPKNLSNEMNQLHGFCSGYFPFSESKIFKNFFMENVNLIYLISRVCWHGDFVLIFSPNMLYEINLGSLGVCYRESM